MLKFLNVSEKWIFDDHGNAWTKEEWREKNNAKSIDSSDIASKSHKILKDLKCLKE